MSERLHTWTPNTSTGLLNDELDHLWQDTVLTPAYMEARLSAAQTANLAAGNHVEFDVASKSAGGITLATGTGQANGIFTLPIGTYWITAFPEVTFSAAGVLQLRWRDSGGGALSANFATIRPYSSTADQFGSAAAHALVEVTGSSLDVKLEIIGTPSNVSNIHTRTVATIITLSRT